MASIDEETTRNSLWGGDSGNESIFSGDNLIDDLDFDIAENDKFVSPMQEAADFAIDAENIAVSAEFEIKSNTEKRSDNRH